MGRPVALVDSVVGEGGLLVLLPANANDDTFVFNTIPNVCVRGPDRDGPVKTGVTLDSLFSRDNNSLAFALVVLVVLGVSLLYSRDGFALSDDDELDTTRSMELEPPAGDLGDTTLGLGIGLEGILSSRARSLPFADVT